MSNPSLTPRRPIPKYITQEEVEEAEAYARLTELKLEEDKGNANHNNNSRDPNNTNTNTNRCQSCSKPALTSCGNCNLVYYCSKSCQIKDWKQGGHKTNCFPFERRLIKDQNGLDRTHIFATKTYQPGEILWREYPLVYSFTDPELYFQFRDPDLKLCTICCGPLHRKHMVPCQKCHVLTCGSKQCLQDKFHASFECSVIANANKQKVTPAFLDEMKLTDFLLIVRLLKLRKDNPAAWQKFLSLDFHPHRKDFSRTLAHLQDQDEFTEQLVSRLVFLWNALQSDSIVSVQAKQSWYALSGAVALLVSCPEAKNITPKEMDEIVNKMKWNSVDDTTLQTRNSISSHIKWIAYNGSSVDHSCYPNATWKVDPQTRQLVFRARFEIKPGEELTICRFPAFTNDYTLMRRQMMFEHKNFLCCCECCEDPTELGSYCSLYKCSVRSCSGYLLPIKKSKEELNLIFPFEDSICNLCYAFVPAEQIQNFYLILKTSNSELYDAPKTSPAENFEYILKRGPEILKDWTETLVHSNHSIVLQVKNFLASKLTWYTISPPVQHYGKYQPMNEKIRIIRQAFFYWEDVLNSNSLSVRGYTFRRGLVLAGYYCCLAYIKLNGTVEQIEEFSSQCLNLEKIRIEAEDILSFYVGHVCVDNVLLNLRILQGQLGCPCLCSRCCSFETNKIPLTLPPVEFKKLLHEGKEIKVVVATSAFKSGEVLWEENPLVYGPIDPTSLKKLVQLKFNICVSCCKEFPHFNGKSCEICTCGTCGSDDCSLDHVHLVNECQVFTTLRRREFIHSLTFIPRMDLLFVCRILKLRENPEKWKSFLNLPMHPEMCNFAALFPGHSDVTPGLIKELTEKASSLSTHEKEYLLKLAGLVNLIVADIQATCWKVKDLDDVLNRMQWNVVENEVYGLRDKDTHVKWIATTGSQLRHSCAPNVIWKMTAEKTLVFRALNDIKIGDELVMCLEPSGSGSDLIQRREILYICKYFRCSCRRCSDPSELGTYSSAYKCLNKRCKGYLLMTKPLESHCRTSDWECDVCSSVFDWVRVHDIIRKTVDESAKAYEKLTIARQNICSIGTRLKIINEAQDLCEKWINHFLHPNHALLSSIQYEIIHVKFLNVFQFDLDKESTRIDMVRLNSQAKDIAQYCKKVLAKKNEFGLEESSPQRGKILGFYYCSLCFLCVNGREGTRMEFAEDLRRLDLIRVEAENIIQFYEPVDKFMHVLVNLIISSKRGLEEFLFPSN